MTNWMSAREDEIMEYTKAPVREKIMSTTWATKAAEEIMSERVGGTNDIGIEETRDIILKHTAPLVALLRESKREHSLDCPENPSYRCTCGADAWNARVEAALGRQKCDGNHGGPRCADPECWNQ